MRRLAKVVVFSDVGGGLLEGVAHVIVATVTHREGFALQKQNFMDCAVVFVKREIYSRVRNRGAR